MRGKAKADLMDGRIFAMADGLERNDRIDIMGVIQGSEGLKLRRQMRHSSRRSDISKMRLFHGVAFTIT